MDHGGKKSRFGGSKQRQQLFRLENLHTVLFSIQALQKSIVHPYILKKLRLCLKPIAIVAAAVYLAGLALLIPLTIISFLVSLITLGYCDSHWLMNLGRSWVKESVALVPFLAILAMKTFIRSPLHKCFLQILREINPVEAARLEANNPAGGSEKADNEAARVRGRRALRILKKAAFLLLADMVLGRAQKGHVIGGVTIGRILVALSHFYTMKKVLGRDRAIMLALLGVIPYVEPWILKFVDLWRASNLLGEELISEYLRFSVPAESRSKFLKAHDLDLPLFAMPGSLLLLIPIVGPLFFVPLQASAAFLVDRLSKETNLHTEVSTPSPPKARWWQQISKEELQWPQPPTLPAGTRPDVKSMPVY